MRAQEQEPRAHEHESLVGPMVLTTLSVAAAIVLAIWAVRHDEQLTAVVVAPSNQQATAPNPATR